MDERPVVRGEGGVTYLQLEAEDTAASVRDRLAFLRGGRVALVWPETGVALTRKIDLVLVQREAMRHSVQLAIVTHDAGAVQIAHELDISAFETLAEAGRVRRWKRGRARSAATRLKRPAPLDPEVLMPVASRVRGEEATPRERALRAAGRAGALIVLAALLAAALVLLGPSAQVTLPVEERVVRVEAVLTADPLREPGPIDAENGIIPAVTIRAELEERGTVPTTGRRALASIPAGGTIALINRTDAAVEVPAGTLVSTSAGTPIVFRTLETVLLNAGADAQAEVGIEAIPEAAGPVGNLDAGLINTVIGPLAEQVTVRNLTPTTGGEGEAVAIVAAADHERLLATLRQQLQERAFRELSAINATSGESVMIAETVRIEEEREDWQVFDRAVGEAAETVSLTMRAIVAVTAIDEAQAQSAAYSALSRAIAQPDEAASGRVIDLDSLAYTRSAPSALFANGSVQFAMTAEALTRPDLDVNAVVAGLVGLSPAEAAARLAGHAAAPVSSAQAIAIEPAWWGRMPLLAQRIRLELVPVGAVPVRAITGVSAEEVSETDAPVIDQTPEQAGRGG